MVVSRLESGLRQAMRIACVWLAVVAIQAHGQSNEAAWIRPAGRPTTVFTSVKAASQEPERAHHYRIPALVVLPGGELLAFAEARRTGGGDAGDIDTVVRRSTDGGSTWGPEILVAGDGDNTMGNPCPVVLPGGRVLLLLTWNSGRLAEHKVQPGFGADSRRVFVCHSDDAGQTWSPAREITEHVKRPDWTWYATGPGAGLRLTRGSTAGRVVIPCDHKSPAGNFSHLILSDDDGSTWRIGAVSPPGLNECVAVELADGAVMVNSRNHGTTMVHRGVCVSPDGGETFDDGLFRRDQTLVEPRCQASTRRHSWPQGDEPGLILFSNPASSSKRTAMTIRGSRDEADTWPLEYTVYPGGSAYSDLAVQPDGRLLLLFEKDGYATIEFCSFELVPPGVPMKDLRR